MSEVCETVKVKSPVTEENPTGYIVINKSDLGDTHEVFVEADKHESDEFDLMQRDELKAYLAAASVEFAGNTGDAKLRVLCREIVK